MNKGYFITCPDYASFAPSAHNPWKDKQFNNRNMKLDDRGGLLTLLRKFNAEGVKSALLRITSLGVFEATLNGKRIGDDELMPLWTDYNHRVFEIEYDIKPYLKFTDSHEDAVGGFADGVIDYKISVDFPAQLLEKIEPCEQKNLITLLENDPRPAYREDSDEEYGMKYSRYEIFFKVNNGVLTVTGVK